MTHEGVTYRRRRMIEMILQGLSPTEIIQQLLKDKEVTVQESTLWVDWRTREQWTPEYARIDKAQQDIVKSDFFVTLKAARRLLMNTYLRAPNPKHRVDALRELRANVQAEAEMRQTLGLLEREPIKHEVKQELKAEGFVGPEDLARYIGTLVKIALEEEARELNADDGKEDPRKSLG